MKIRCKKDNCNDEIRVNTMKLKIRNKLGELKESMFTWSSSKQAHPLSRQLHFESFPATVDIFPSVVTFLIRLIR